MKLLAVVLGVLCIVLAVLTWWGHTSFAPILGLNGHHHTKHTILYAVLAVLCFMWARMSDERAAA